MNMNELALPEDDHDLQDYFPKPVPYHLQSQIEYRVKLILKENTTFYGGEMKVVNTSMKISGKLKGKNSACF